MAAEPGGRPGQRPYVGPETGNRQQEIWAKVRKVQDGLSSNLGVKVNAAASQSSLQLALENEKLKDAQSGYLAALRIPADASSPDAVDDRAGNTDG